MEPIKATITAAPDGTDKPLKKSKRRAAQACISCRARKVRCDVFRGAPCTNCTWDQIECVVSARRPRRSAKLLAAAGEKSRATIRVAEVTSDRRTCSHLSSRRGNISAPCTELLREIANLIKEPCRRPSEAETHDRITASLDLPSFIQSPRSGISEAAINYLEASGTFELPASEIQELLLEAYMNWVQPSTLITEYGSCEDVTNAQRTVSLFVYLGMLFAGSFYIGEGQAASFGCKNREELTRHIFNMMKALYIMDYDNDKLVLIQGTLLLSISTGSGGFHEQNSSYWLSIAVNLAQEMGLQRMTSLAGLSSKTRRLRKRVWWACVIRDAELSLATCSTPRIPDNGVAMLSAEDFEGHECFEYEQLSQAELIIQRARLSSLLLETLTFRYSGSGNVIRSDRPIFIDKMQAALASWMVDLPASCSLNSAVASLPSPPAESLGEHHSTDNAPNTLNLQRSLLHMQYQATLGALVRPTTISSTDEAPASFSDAAANILTLSSSLYRRGRAYKYMPPTSAAMTVHALLAHTLMQSAPGTSNHGPGPEMRQIVKDCIALVEGIKKRSNGLVSRFAARYLESRRENNNSTHSRASAERPSDQNSRNNEIALETRKRGARQLQQHNTSSATPTSAADYAFSSVFVTTPLIPRNSAAVMATEHTVKPMNFPISPIAATSSSTFLTPCLSLTPFHISHNLIKICDGSSLSLDSDQVSPNGDTSVLAGLNMDDGAIFNIEDWMELSDETSCLIDDVEHHLSPGGGASNVSTDYGLETESLLLDSGLVGV